MAFLGALGTLASLGQFAEIGQGHIHQREQTRWSRRNYELDAQALKIDLLGAARDDIRGTFDTYIQRLDTLLLLNALLLPFALNTLQISDGFALATEDQCHDCIQASCPWLTTLWVYLVGLSLVAPFWSILLLLRCKLRMDTWLQQTLDDLQELRRDIIIKFPSAQAELVLPNTAGHQPLPEGTVAAEQERVVAHLGAFIIEKQQLFAERWATHCAPFVWWATRMLCFAAYVALTLTAFMFWVFLVNRRGQQNVAHVHFAGVLLVGLLMPALCFLWTRVSRRHIFPLPPPETEPVLLQTPAAAARAAAGSDGRVISADLGGREPFDLDGRANEEVSRLAGAPRGAA